jgi:hypothetical protein
MANTQTTVPLFVANQVLTAAQQNTSAGTGVPVFATTVTRDAAFGGSNKALAEGQLAYIEASNIVQYYDGAAWATLGPSTGSTRAIFNETQAANTAGGTNTTGSFTKRTLNTTLVNSISGCSIAASVITLPAGTYVVTASAPFYSTARAQLRLRNTTDSTNDAIGQSGYYVTAYEVQGVSQLMGYFTITGNKNYELQYYSQTVQATNGLGLQMNFGVSEIYSQISIEKIA